MMSDQIETQADNAGETRWQPTRFAVRSGCCGGVAPILNLCKIVIHFAWGPTPVAGHIRDRLPVTVVWPDDDHRVMSSTAAYGSSTRIENSMTSLISLNDVLGILSLTFFVRVVADVKVQTHILILGGPAVK